MTVVTKAIFIAGVMAALAGCAPQPPSQAAAVDPVTGLPACNTNAALIPNSGNRIVQTPNSLPEGSKELSSSCLQGNAAPYAAH